jgi:hypothetical protein
MAEENLARGLIESMDIKVWAFRKEGVTGEQLGLPQSEGLDE